MNREASFRTAVCSEYEALLHRCKAYMDECRKATEDESAARDDDDRARRKEMLARRLEQYERAYAKLKTHFDNCRRCQSARGPRRYYPRVVA
jgi:hypothetical protein